MQFIVNQQVAVEADTPEEAMTKTKPVEGARISFSVNPRPQQPVGSVTGNSPQARPTVTIIPAQ